MTWCSKPAAQRLISKSRPFRLVWTPFLWATSTHYSIWPLRPLKSVYVARRPCRLTCSRASRLTGTAVRIMKRSDDSGVSLSHSRRKSASCTSRLCGEGVGCPSTWRTANSTRSPCRQTWKTKASRRRTLASLRWTCHSTRMTRSVAIAYCQLPNNTDLLKQTEKNYKLLQQWSTDISNSLKQVFSFNCHSFDFLVL